MKCYVTQRLWEKGPCTNEATTHAVMPITGELKPVCTQCARSANERLIPALNQLASELGRPAIPLCVIPGDN